MGSEFKGLDLFGSGPHEFRVGRQGRRVVSLSTVSGDPTVPGTFESGDWELRVDVKGRLVASSESALWTLRDAIVAESAFNVSGGDLIDQYGHTWAGVKLLEVNWDSAVERGRVLSIGYTAEFGVTQ